MKNQCRMAAAVSVYPSKPVVLIVDDDTLNAKLLKGILSPDYEIRIASNGEEALCASRDSATPDLILLDIMMPDMDGYEVCRQLKFDPQTRNIPVIFVSALSEEKEGFKGLKLGAVDSIRKPFNPDSIRTRVSTHLELKRHRDHLESLVDQRTAELKLANTDLRKEIAQRSAAEHSLRKRETQLSAIVDNIAEFIYTCDRSHRIIFMNQALKGYIGRDVTGQICYRVLFNRNAPCSQCALERVFAGETVKQELQSPVGDLWYYAVYSPVTDAEGRVSCGQTMLVDITDRKLAEAELQRKTEQLAEENERLKSSIGEGHRIGNIVGQSRVMQAVYHQISEAAISDAGVIVYGESGTGKELAARAIHELSDRSGKEFVVVNCGAIPDTLLESEFFGHKRGAFSGAHADKLGFLDLANGGTLFLDEIGELSLGMQVKLLHVLENGSYTPIGDTRVRRADLRIVAATHRDLAEQVKEGAMREDFFYRIHVVPVRVPALRERLEDLPLLINHFLKQFNTKEKDPRRQLSASQMQALLHHNWPGNVRELKNVLQRFVTVGRLDLNAAPAADRSSNEAPRFQQPQGTDLRGAVEAFEKDYIASILDQNQWHRTKVASMLGITRKTLFSRMKRLGLG